MRIFTRQYTYFYELAIFQRNEGAAAYEAGYLRPLPKPEPRYWRTMRSYRGRPQVPVSNQWDTYDGYYSNRRDNRYIDTPLDRGWRRHPEDYPPVRTARRTARRRRSAWDTVRNWARGTYRSLPYRLRSRERRRPYRDGYRRERPRYNRDDVLERSIFTTRTYDRYPEPY